MAPEILASEPYNEKVDVYSYGIVLWELLTRKCPYEDLSAFQCAIAVVNEDRRPEIPPWCPPAFESLIRNCIQRNPDDRPSFAKVLRALEGMP